MWSRPRAEPAGNRIGRLGVEEHHVEAHVPDRKGTNGAECSICDESQGEERCPDLYLTGGDGPLSPEEVAAVPPGAGHMIHHLHSTSRR